MTRTACTARTASGCASVLGFVSILAQGWVVAKIGAKQTLVVVFAMIAICNVGIGLTTSVTTAAMYAVLQPYRLLLVDILFALWCKCGANVFTTSHGQFVHHTVHFLVPSYTKFVHLVDHFLVRFASPTLIIC